MPNIQHQRQPGYPYQVFIPPDTNAGIPWMVAWQPPHFAKLTATFLQQFQYAVQSVENYKVGISGISWMRAWEPPYFPKQTKVYLQKTEAMFLSKAVGFPVGISGIAWYQPFVPWFKPRYPATLQQTTLQVIIQTLAGVSGMSWFYNFDQPRQVRVETYIQQHTIQTVHFMWQGYTRAMIFGGAR